MTKTELMETYTAEQLADIVIELEGELKTIRNLENEVLFEERIVNNIRNATGMNIDDVRKAVQDTKKYMNDTYTEELKNQIEHMKSEVEKYRKAFEDAKKECDCQVAEYQKKIDELENHHKFCMMQIDDVLVEFLGVTHEVMDKPNDFEMVLQELIDKNKTELERAKNTINQIDEILEELFGVTHDVAKPDGFKEILTEKVCDKISDFLPPEPIKIADMLISATYTRQKGSMEKALHKAFGNNSDTVIENVYSESELRQIAEHLLVYCNHNVEDGNETE